MSTEIELSDTERPAPKPLQTKPKWEAGKCCHDDCTWTMVTPCGAGLHICWMHYIMLDLPL